MCLLIVVVPYVDRCVTRSKDEGGRAGRQIAPLVSLELGTLDGGLEPPASRGLFEFSKSKLGHVLRGYSHCRAASPSQRELCFTIVPHYRVKYTAYIHSSGAVRARYFTR